MIKEFLNLGVLIIIWISFKSVKNFFEYFLVVLKRLPFINSKKKLQKFQIDFYFPSIWLYFEPLAVWIIRKWLFGFPLLKFVNDSDLMPNIFIIQFINWKTLIWYGRLKKHIPFAWQLRNCTVNYPSVNQRNVIICSTSFPLTQRSGDIRPNSQSKNLDSSPNECLNAPYTMNVSFGRAHILNFFFRKLHWYSISMTY